MPRTKSTGESSPTVRQRLLQGTLGLIESEGGDNLSVRRLAEASGRSTMCVYSCYGGRGALLDAAHRNAAAALLGDVADRGDPAGSLRDWLRSKGRLGLWLLTVTDPDEVTESRTALITALREVVDGPELAGIVGELVLGDVVSFPEPVEGRVT